MVAPFISLNFQVSGSPQIVRYAGTNASTVGNTFGSLDVFGTAPSGTLNLPLMPRGRVIRFGGLNTYLATVGNAIFRSTDGGTTWTSVLTLPSINTANHRKSGFAVVYLNGLPAVCMIYQSTSTTETRGAFSFDGVTWTTQGPFTTVGNGATANVGFNDTLVMGSTMVVALGSGPAGTDVVIFYTPGSNNQVAVTPAGIGNSNVSPAICVFNNRLFVLYVRTASTNLTLGEIVGQQAVVIDLIESSSFGLGMSGSACTLFVDGANMYAISLGSNGTSNTGFKVWQFTAALTRTEITSTVLPTVLRSAFPSFGGNFSTRCLAIVDGVTSPGSSPTIYLMFSASSNSIWALYRWNGNATEISLISQGGSTLQSIPFFDNVTGTYFVSDSVFPSTAGISVEITNRIFTATGVRLSFKIYGTSAGGAVSFRVYVGDEFAEYPTIAGTLTDPSVGAISGGNINTGLTADNGATTYLVTWAAQTDGFSTNEQFRLIGDAFV